jgi:5'-methylthioadenosine phosphorylase
MSAELAVIGGLGFEPGGLTDEINTPYGIVKLWRTRFKGHKIIFIPRHGEFHVPPHRANYRAVIRAIKDLGIERIIATNTVGTMKDCPIGCFFIPQDFVEFTKYRSNTFHEERAVHVDMSQPYCPQLRSSLIESLLLLGFEPYQGVYVCTEGPHLESPAQIRMLRQFGDVVGMTGYPETVLAKELELCYASLCIVTNHASGMKPEKQGSILKEISISMKSIQKTLEAIISNTAQILQKERSCSCKGALVDAKL